MNSQSYIFTQGPTTHIHCKFDSLAQILYIFFYFQSLLEYDFLYLFNYQVQMDMNQFWLIQYVVPDSS